MIVVGVVDAAIELRTNPWRSAPSGKPTRPNGPLVVDDVYDKGAILKWKKPDDDGGMPIKEYVIEKMDMDTGQ